MSTVQQVYRNTGWIISGRVFVGVLSVAVNVFVARHLGVEFFGVYSFLFTYVGLFIVVANLGIDAIVVREMSQKRDQYSLYLSQALFLKTALGICAAALSCAIIHLLPYAANVRDGASVAAFSLIFTAWVGSFSTVFQANLRMHRQIISDVASKLCFAVLTVFAVTLGKGLLWIIIANVAAAAIQVLIGYALAKAHISLSLSPRWNVLRFLLRESWPLAMTSAFVTIYVRVDILMLSLMRSQDEIGLYAAAANLAEKVLILPMALMASLYPLLSASRGSDSPGELEDLASTACRLMLLVGVPITLGTTVVSTEAVNSIYGEGFAPASIALAYSYGELCFRL